MFGFGSGTPDKECALIIDIGSGSVGAALVVSDSTEKTTTALWTHREHIPIGKTKGVSGGIKQISTALMNTLLEYGTKAHKVLEAQEERVQVGFIQVSVSAPWAYCVMKRVNYTDDVPFEITPTLVAEVTQTATRQATELILESEELSAKGIVALDNQNIGVVANGYTTDITSGAETRELSVAHLTALTHKGIIDAVVDSQQKLLPKTELFSHAFMYTYYEVMQSLKPDTTEACLIDITHEATEIGIIRDGLLTHVSHVPHGIATLTREVAAICDIPVAEAQAYLKGGEQFIAQKLNKVKENELTIAFTAYQERVAALFKETGDRLAIPKTLYIHTDAHCEKFFKKQIADASFLATGMKHSLHLVTSKVLDKKDGSDTALELSMRYFHIKHRDLRLES